MWLRLSNGREELVVNEDHINRLLNEGAVEIPDPRLQTEDMPLAVESAQANEQSSPDIEGEEVMSTQKKQPSKRATKPAKE